MSNAVICEIVLGYNWLEHVEYILKVLSEILWLDFCEFIEFYKSIFKNSLVIFLQSFHGDLGHQREKLNKISGIFSFGDLEEVGNSLEGCQVDIKTWMAQSLCKNSC